MFNKLAITACLCLEVCFANASTLRAGDFESAVRPYLEDTTVVLAHVDLTKFDKQALINWLRANADEAAVRRAGTAIGFSVAMIQSLVQTGATHIYASASTLDLARGGVVLYIPCQEPANVRLLVETMVAQVPARLGYKVFTAEELVVVATPTTWNRILSKPNAAREAMASIGDSSHAATVMVNLPERLQKEMAHMLPTRTPASWHFELSPRSLLSDNSILRLTIDLPPKPAVLLQFASESEAGAQRTQDALEQLRIKLPKPADEIEVTRDSPRTLILAAREPAFIAIARQLIGSALHTADESHNSNSLKQIMLAMHNYHSAHNFLPPRETRSKDDRPLLSWRVHILPYIDQQALYARFHLNEPWDSPHNAKLIAQMPALYGMKSDEVAQGKTRFVLPMLEGGAWKGDGPPLKFEHIIDGTSNTIAVVAAPAEKSVLWTKPEELELTPENLIDALFGESDTFLAALFDGSVRAIGRANNADTIQARITMQGGEVVTLQ